jgi:two-component system nitrogen regulation response regulator GlnG
MAAILIVDDEQSVRWAFSQLARTMGHTPKAVATAEEAFAALEDQAIELAIVDIQLPGMDGLAALEQLSERYPEVPVIIITAHGTMETAIEATARGAFEYLLKPVELQDVKLVIEAALAATVTRARIAATAAEAPPAAETTMVGRCEPMQEVYKRIGAVAGARITVLIEGETGTGKELVARAIHQHSGRKDKAFIAFNCACMDGPLLESELFGHEKGAFTGADATKVGKIELADGGTILLDEIGEMPLEAQAKLLRFLEDRCFFRVGGTALRSADVRILAATNRQLRPLAASGAFRRDLFYRLGAVTIALPPLRDRGEDLDLLVDHFLQRGAAAGGSAPVIGEAARAAIRRYNWPGNVRELRHAVEMAALMARGGRIEPTHLPESVHAPEALGEPPAEGLARLARKLLADALAAERGAGFEALMAQFERPLLAAALEHFDGNQSAVAKALGMHRATLRNKLRSHGLVGGRS